MSKKDSQLVDVKRPAPATVFGKVAQCSRCNASPLSWQEIQNGWLCGACADIRLDANGDVALGEPVTVADVVDKLSSDDLKALVVAVDWSKSRPYAAGDLVRCNGEQHVAAASGTSNSIDQQAFAEVAERLAEEFANFQPQPHDFVEPLHIDTSIRYDLSTESGRDDLRRAYSAGPTREECMDKLNQTKFAMTREVSVSPFTFTREEIEQAERNGYRISAQEATEFRERDSRRECPLCFVALTMWNSRRHAVVFPAASEHVIVTCDGERCMAWAKRVQEQAVEMCQRAMEVDTSGVPVGTAPALRRCAYCLAETPLAAICAVAVHWQDGTAAGVVETCTSKSCREWALRGVRRAAVLMPGIPLGRVVWDGTPIADSADRVTPTTGIRTTGTVNYTLADAVPHQQRKVIRCERTGHTPVGTIAVDGYVPTVEIAGYRPAPPRPDGFSQSQVDAAKAVLLASVQKPKRGGK